ncbi:MAG: hypothetical protein HY296_04855 [Thaumarchaeota archaeon]|nr:hypothetical protein [Nitrososphaerota archaeon]
MLELNKSSNGLVLTKLTQKLGWKRTDAKRVLDDLEFSGMTFVDDMSHWAFARQKGRGLVDHSYLFEISPKGLTFLKHWEAINKLRSTEGSYSKYGLVIEGPLKRYYEEPKLDFNEYKE